MHKFIPFFIILQSCTYMPMIDEAVRDIEAIEGAGTFGIVNYPPENPRGLNGPMQR